MILGDFFFLLIVNIVSFLVTTVGMGIPIDIIRKQIGV